MAVKFSADRMGDNARARARGWAFTLNNPSDEDSLIMDPAEWVRDNRVSYLVYQKEEGANGTPHLQGYAYFANARSFTAVKRMLPRAHLEAARGNPQQNIDYCTKEEGRIDGPFEFGERPSAGKRSDLEAVREKIRAGASEMEIAENFFPAWCRYHRAFLRYRNLSNQVDRSWQTKLIVLWGPSGTGKSRQALAYGGRQYWLPDVPRGQPVWWDGYDDHDTVVIDEFYGWISRTVLQRLVDRYPYYVQGKGTSVRFVAKTVIITSNNPPESWYPRSGLGAMARRLQAPIGTVRYIGEPLYGDIANRPELGHGLSEDEYRAKLGDLIVGRSQVRSIPSNPAPPPIGAVPL